MKYLSKHYRPAEKELFKLIEELRKAIKLEEAAGRKVPKDAYEFLEVLDDGIEKIEDHVGNRIRQAEEKEQAEAERRANERAECPHCKEMTDVRVINEVRLPKTGVIHDICKCKVCGTEFTNMMPREDEDMMKWQANFNKKLKEIQPDGRPLWQCVGTTEEELKELELSVQKWEEAVKKEKEAFRIRDEAQAIIDKNVVEMRDGLLMIRLQMQNWNGGDAKA